ncbi:TraR/DksA family transcriptional regulator [Actinocorallia lasiicapitis]
MLTRIDRSIAVLREEHSDRGVRPAEAGDAGNSLIEADHRYATLDVLLRQRTAVEAALTRLSDGTYGTCTTCGKPVPEGRLEARPEAARCIPCQTRHDRRNR